LPRILFIGNSYTSRNNLPRLVAELAAAADPPQQVEFALVFSGGASLRRHWNAGRAQELLQAKTWDYRSRIDNAITTTSGFSPA